MARRPDGYRLIGGHYPPDVCRAFNMLAAEQGRTHRAMLAEAIDLLLAKHGKPTIAKESCDANG